MDIRLQMLMSLLPNQRTGDLVEEVLVKVSEKEEYKASIIGFDRSTDIAVLKIDADRPLPYVVLVE